MTPFLGLGNTVCHVAGTTLLTDRMLPKRAANQLRRPKRSRLVEGELPRDNRPASTPPGIGHPLGNWRDGAKLLASKLNNPPRRTPWLRGVKQIGTIE
jgi:hypothetical protein